MGRNENFAGRPNVTKHVITCMPTSENAKISAIVDADFLRF